MARFQIRFPVLEYSGSYPKLSNKVEEFPEGLLFTRFASTKEHLPFHGFVDDWRLEALWRSGNFHVHKAALCGYAVAPDFSVYPNYPAAYSIYQVLRSRMIASFWQQHGVNVIPVLSWTHIDDPDFHRYIEGLESCEVLAVRAPTRGYHSEWEECASRINGMLKPKMVFHFGLKAGSHVWQNCRVLPLNPKR